MQRDESRKAKKSHGHMGTHTGATARRWDTGRGRRRIRTANAITPQQARTAFARYCKKIDVTKEELAWNFGCISASQSNEQEAVLVRELILSNNKRLYNGAQSAADRTAATADMAETSVRQRAAGTEGGSDGDGDGDGGEGEEGGPLTPDSERGREERGREESNGDATGSRGHDEQVDNGQGDGEDEETRDDGRRDEEDGGEGRGSATVDGGDNDGEGEGTTQRAQRMRI